MGIFSEQKWGTSVSAVTSPLTPERTSCTCASYPSISRSPRSSAQTYLAGCVRGEMERNVHMDTWWTFRLRNGQLQKRPTTTVGTGPRCPPGCDGSWVRRVEMSAIGRSERRATCPSILRSGASTRRLRYVPEDVRLFGVPALSEGVSSYPECQSHTCAQEQTEREVVDHEHPERRAERESKSDPDRNPVRCLLSPATTVIAHETYIRVFAFACASVARMRRKPTGVIRREMSSWTSSGHFALEMDNSPRNLQSV